MFSGRISNLQYKITVFCPFQNIGCNGTYGDDCFYPCPTNCLDRKCDTDTGHCLGCDPGYNGQRCNQGMFYIIPVLIV